MCRDPDIDIVDLGTRPAIRLPMVLEALRHGKHVYNSCPHAPHWEGARAIDAAWDRTASQAAVDAFSRHIPAHRKMQTMIAQGYLGRVLGGICRFNMSLFNRPDRRFPYNWFAEGTAGVSALRNFGSHLLYLLCEWFGPVEELVADLSLVLDTWTFEDGGTVTPENPDYANLILRFASGPTISVQTSWSHSAQEGWVLDLFGTDGRLRASAPSFPTMADTILEAGEAGSRNEESLHPVLMDPQPDSQTSLPWISTPPPAYPMALTMASLVRAIDAAGTAAPDFALALEVERTLEAARISHAERRWVRPATIG